jgi:hypothetical protein
MGEVETAEFSAPAADAARQRRTYTTPPEPERFPRPPGMVPPHLYAARLFIVFLIIGLLVGVVVYAMMIRSSNPVAEYSGE